MDLNKVFIIGRLTKDPELRAIPSGQEVATLSIATNRVWNDKSGARQTEVEYHTVVVWGRQASVANQFLKKGSMVFIEGRIRTRSWQDNQGQTRKTTEIVADRMQLGPRPGGGGFSGGVSQNVSASALEKDDIPVIDIESSEGQRQGVDDLPF